MEKLNQGLPTRQQFVELVRSYLETLLKTTDLIEEDTVYQELVLNLRAGDDAVSVIKLNPPYNLLVDLDKVSLGRPAKPQPQPRDGRRRHGTLAVYRSIK